MGFYKNLLIDAEDFDIKMPPEGAESLSESVLLGLVYGDQL